MNISSDRTVTICRSLYRTAILSGFMFSTYRSSVDLRRPEEGGGGEEDIHISGSPPPPSPLISTQWRASCTVLSLLSSLINIIRKIEKEARHIVH